MVNTKTCVSSAGLCCGRCFPVLLPLLPCAAAVASLCCCRCFPVLLPLLPCAAAVASLCCGRCFPVLWPLLPCAAAVFVSRYFLLDVPLPLCCDMFCFNINVSSRISMLPQKELCASTEYYYTLIIGHLFYLLIIIIIYICISHYTAFLKKIIY